MKSQISKIMVRENINPRISAIAAIGRNRELGAGNELLWHLPEDFKHFKEATMGKPIIMGSTTYESIGKALPGRLNIVLTRRADYMAEGCVVAHSLEDAVALAQERVNNDDVDEVFIIGGANVYKQALDSDIVDRLYLTLVDADFQEADVFFPEYNKFTKVATKAGSKDETFNYKFVTLERNAEEDTD